MRLFTAILGLICLLSCSSEQNHTIENPTQNPAIVTNDAIEDSTTVIAIPSYSFEVFETPALGWGYKIFDNGTLFINQPHIPAIPGNKGFSTKAKAEITANFAITKMEQGFVPPTISPEELDSLGVLN